MIKPYIIAIAGASGSGKSTFVKKTVAACGKHAITVISQDHYYRDMSHLSKSQRDAVNYDHPDQIEHALLAEHLGELAAGRTISAPHYDFATHTRKKHGVMIEPRPIILCEGLFCLHYPMVRSLADLTIYFDVAVDICLARRIRRDLRLRGRTLPQVIDQYMTTVRPMFRQFIEPSREFADVILQGERGAEHLIQHIVGISQRRNKRR